MSFTSQAFLVLLAVVLGLYFVLGHRRQNRLLLLASLVFYGWWDWRFLFLLVGATAIDWAVALGLDRRRHPDRPQRTRRALLAVSVVSNLATLGFFKYAGFFIESLRDAFGALGADLPIAPLHVILPVGISFYTFQILSYTIDVYRDELAAEPRFTDVLLFVSFFPQLVAGPIERASHLLPQVQRPRSPTLTGIASGAELAFVGYFKKIVIADNMALLADAAFRDPAASGLDVAIGVHAFALQIYADFSAYSDIPRGIARMLGFELMVNFKLPFPAATASDFWRRWHVSLSSWLRDYLYVPLGGNRGGAWKTRRNLLVTMLLGGLWHGAAWNFIAWGAWHGLLLLAYRPFEPPGREPLTAGPRGPRGWLAVLLFFELACFGWLLFRAPTIGRAWEMMMRALGGELVVEPRHLADLGRLLAVGLPLLAVQVVQQRTGDLEVWRRLPAPLRAAFYVALWFGITLFGAEATHAFIYFQF